MLIIPRAVGSTTYLVKVADEHIETLKEALERAVCCLYFEIVVDSSGFL